jgi:prepilin-type N-terminal cleavage/methylation domain-containing protein/prepilin-type processing-associated H-X9-DG protein
MRVSSLRRGEHKAAFTLVELLVVMGIIAVLMAIIVPAVMKAREVSNRVNCVNNLHQMGVATQHYVGDVGYFPTAGVIDFDAPSFPTPVFSGTKLTSGASPMMGWQQQAGWAYQILHYMGEDLVWAGGSAQTTTANATTNAAALSGQAAQMEAALQVPFKFYTCPSRRPLTTQSYTVSATNPVVANYSLSTGTVLTFSMIDYAGCNGGIGASGSGSGPGTGVIRSQSVAVTSGGTTTYSQARNTVRMADLKDGPAYTLLIAEKAANPRYFPITNEDDTGYALGYSANNLNSLRFAYPTLLPLRDGEVTGPTGGAFGSAHPSGCNALMADGSVQLLSFTINPTVFGYLGNINDGNIVTANDFAP